MGNKNYVILGAGHRERIFCNLLKNSYKGKRYFMAVTLDDS